MKPRVIRITKIVCLIIAFCFAVFWIAGCRRYTSVGIDSDSKQGAYVTTHYYRVRWPGDGSFWMGHGQFSFVPSVSYKLMPFDWGGRFFKQPRIIPPRSFWNRIGFWRDRVLPSPSSNPEMAPRESWIAIPGWLPVLLFLLPLLKKRERRRPASDSFLAPLS